MILSIQYRRKDRIFYDTIFRTIGTEQIVHWKQFITSFKRHKQNDPDSFNNLGQGRIHTVAQETVTFPEKKNF